MMSRKTKCPSCHSVFGVPDSPVGETVHCPQCQATLRLASSTASSADSGSASDSKPQGNQSAGSSSSPRNASSANTRSPQIATTPDGLQSPLSNPYAALPYTPPMQISATSIRTERSPTIYVIPGAFLMGWSVIMVLAAVIWSIMGTTHLWELGPPSSRGDTLGMVVLFFMLCIQLCCGLLTLVGSFAMIRRKGLKLARMGAISSMIGTFPCFGSFLLLGCFSIVGNMVVFPFGVWACVLLFSGPVQRDFGCETPVATS